MVAREKWPLCTASRRRARKFTFSTFLTFHTNSLWFLMIFEKSRRFEKFTSRNLIFFLSHVCGGFRVQMKTCRTSAVILTIFFWPETLRPCIHRAVRAKPYGNFFFRPPKKTYCKTPAPLTICSKPTVKPQRRCWCDFCPTSPAPLLEISETSLKPS